MENNNSEELDSEQRAKQAQKLFVAGQAKFVKGDLIGAEKYLLRSDRLHSSSEAKTLINKIRRMKAANNSEANATGDEQHSEHSKERPSSSSENSERQSRRRKTSSLRSVELDYTKEQLEVVRRIFKSQNHYIILNVRQDATEAEIKDSYKKLALLVHPDKNKAPGANAAFQAIGNAKDILTNPAKRKEYDTTLNQKENLESFSMPDVNFDIPAWLVVGGVTIVAAGLFGLWWNNQNKKKSNEEKMSQDEETSDD